MARHEMRGLLHPFLLLLLLERSSHGYELIERLAGLGVPDVDPSHAYRVLHALERDCLVASTWVVRADGRSASSRADPDGRSASSRAGAGPARRHYELTPAGRADLSEWAHRLAHLERVVGNCVARLAYSGSVARSGAGER
jgi:DNA-binding PadR family transcriptional regulator